MAEQKVRRKLTAILSADVVGYSKLMADDEAATVETISQYRDAIESIVNRREGRVVNAPGDNILAEFASAVEGVQAAVEIQNEVETLNSGLADNRRMHFRIGLNLGDVIEKTDGTIYGDGVNITARMESLAETGGICVSSTIYDAVRGKLKLGFEDLGERSVKNIDEPVRVYRVSSDPNVSSTRSVWARNRFRLVGAVILIATVVGLILYENYFHGSEIDGVAGDPSLALPTGPTIAVLPFDNLSADPEQEYFADGLTEEIIGAIAHASKSPVIGRNSTFRYKGKTIDANVVRDELGAKYLVHGTVRRAADTVRVTAQLVETDTGTQVWNDRYDEKLTAENIFLIQDDIAASVATKIGGLFGVLGQEELTVAKRKPPNELSSYECVLLAMAYWRTLSPSLFEVPRDCLERTIESDPDYGRAWTELAGLYQEEYLKGYKPSSGDPLNRSFKAAQRGIELSPNDARGQVMMASVHFLRGDLYAFKTAADRAIEAPIKDYAGLGLLGLWLCYAGEWEKGLALIADTKALDPFHPKWILFPAYFDHYRKANYEAALSVAHEADLGNYVWSPALIVAALGQLGRTDQADVYIARILTLDPDFENNARANRWRWFRFQEDLLDHFMDGLRKAGLKIPDELTVADE